METISHFLNSTGDLLRGAELMPDFSSVRGIFCAIAWFATILSLVLLFIGLFLDFSADAEGDVPGAAADGDTGHFSVWALVGFLLGLGWGGFVAAHSGMGVLASILIGLALGLMLFFIVAGLMRLIYSLKSDGSLDYGSLVGMGGTVYVTLPPKGESGGQVQVRHPSQLITMPAIQKGDSPLPAQTPIIVEEASTYQLVVRPAQQNQ